MSLAATFSAAFGRRIELEVAQRPLRRAALCDAERRLLRQFADASARAEWQLGRCALKRLLRRLGRPADTSGLRFPDVELSLTHAGGRAAAVHVAGMAGVGVDFEPCRPVAPGIARWFLDEREQAWLAARPGHRQSAELLRLWTVKEAAFKACPGNGGLSLAAIALAEPAAAGGTADVASRGLVLDYLTLPWSDGHLTLALARPRRSVQHGHG